MSEFNSGTGVCTEGLAPLLARAETLAGSGRSSDADALYRVAVAQGYSPVARLEYGGHLFRTDRLAEAADEFRAALGEALRGGDRKLRLAAAHNLAAVYREQGDHRAAANLQQQSLAAETHLAADAMAGEMSASTLSSLANDALLAGDSRLAGALLHRSLALETAAGSIAGEAADWGSLGLVAILESRYSMAVACLRRAYARHRQMGDRRGVGCDLLNLAEVSRRLGRWKSAVRHLQRAVVEFDSAHAGRQANKARLLLSQALRLAEFTSRNPRLN